MAESDFPPVDSGQQNLAAAYWNEQTRIPNHGRRRFWQSPEILGHINAKLSAIPSVEWAGGLHHRLEALLAGRTLERGLAVGAGGGHKEMRLLEKGMVESFVLYDLAEERLELGRQAARQRGLADRMDFRLGDGLEMESGHFDLVHWDNALHHMPDAPQAVQWSWDRLRDDGIMYVYDYVGPNRHQWSNAMVDAGNAVLEALPDRFFARTDSSPWPRILPRPTADEVRAVDPSEAADSERIVGALQTLFPNGELIYLGGAIYHLALNDILENFDPNHDEDKVILDLLMLLDDQLSARGENHFATFLARKQPASPGRPTSRFARGRGKRLNR